MDSLLGFTIENTGPDFVGNVLFTENGGKSFKSWEKPVATFSILDLKDDKNGLFVAHSTKCEKSNAVGFFATSDGGKSFEETNPVMNIFSWDCIHFGDSNRFFVVVNDSELLKVRRE